MELRVNEIFSNMDTKKLCEAFELTNKKNTEEIPTVRGWIMEELEKRNPEAFNSWIDTNDINKMDFPSIFFI